jgi:hypothetical protein
MPGLDAVRIVKVLTISEESVGACGYSYSRESSTEDTRSIAAVPPLAAALRGVVSIVFINAATARTSH